MSTAPINGTEIYYETHGEGFPLVFVHGGFGGLGTGQGGNIPAWVERFAQHFQVVLYDRRSSGRSGFPETAHTMHQFATDIRELLRHLGHDCAHVWGTSAGGPITMQFGLDYPDAAASLVIAESAPWLTRDREILARLTERIAILKTQGADAAYEARRDGGTVGLNLFAATRRAESAEEEAARKQRADAIRAQLATVSREERISRYAGELRTYDAYATFDFTDHFATLAMPILIPYGTGDTVFPEAGWAELAEGKPNATYLPVSGAEHGLATTSKTVSAILDFLLAATPAG
jgi:pimeloyl-ACP methyl ester carboxylesterase